MGVESVSGSSSLDSSVQGWIESTISAAESYAREANSQIWDSRTDGVDEAPKSASERALDAFWANDPNRPSATVPASGGPGGAASSETGSGGGSSGTSIGSTETSTNTTVATSNDRPSWVLDPDGQSATRTNIEKISIVQPSPALFNLIPGFADYYNSLLQPTPTPATTKPNDNPPGGVQEVQDAGAPDAPKEASRIVSGAGAAVDEIINKSPSLRQLWQDAKDRGWRIEFRDRGGSEADPNDSVIWIDRNDIKDVKNFEANMASLLAHELGHAGTPYKPIVQAATEDEYVGKNTAQSMEHEGAAAFNNARTRDEINIGIRGGFDEEYIRIYEQYKSGQITETEAISQMTYFMALEPQAVEGGRYLTKQEVAERDFRERWQADHASN